ncbi:MAG TPA: alkaline phosphatase [Bacteroidetes bacterium]|nr:alkaline phosphatase [Bacteroidota bacterium]
MGLSQISGALYNQGNRISLERFPVVGFQKTYSLNNLVTDSAASATAMATGTKTNNSAIGVDGNEKPLKSILEEAEEKGLATGLIATSSIVHATPAAFVAHQTMRGMYEQIAGDFLKTEIDLFIGGGKQYFDRRTSDDRDLIEELRKRNYLIYDYFNHEIQQVKPSLDKNLAYFTADNQPIPAYQGRDYLPIASQIALEYLDKKNDKGFFVMIEGSQIDWMCHANQSPPLLAELKDFDRTIKKVLDFARKDGETLVIVTADHETGGFAINPGSKMKHLETAFTTNGHTATMVPVFAYGPQAELFEGIYENTEIYFKMREAFGF